MEGFAKMPGLLDNFSVEPEFMIAEGNKVFTKCNAKADGMDTIFGHYAEYTGDMFKDIDIKEEIHRLKLECVGGSCDIDDPKCEACGS